MSTTMLHVILLHPSVATAVRLADLVDLDGIAVCAEEADLASVGGTRSNSLLGTFCPVALRLPWWSGN